MCEYERALAHCQHHLYDRRSKPCDVYYTTGTCQSDIDKTLRVISRVYNEGHFCPDCRDTETGHAEQPITEIEKGAVQGLEGMKKETLGGAHWRDVKWQPSTESICTATMTKADESKTKTNAKNRRESIH